MRDNDLPHVPTADKDVWDTQECLSLVLKRYKAVLNEEVLVLLWIGKYVRIERGRWSDEIDKVV